jgi:hypothetical protein
MKSVEVRFDEDFLARLDASEEVRRLGRSEVLRRAADVYLGNRPVDCRAGEAIDEQYRKAYKDRAGLGTDFEGWEEQGAWPSE